MGSEIRRLWGEKLLPIRPELVGPDVSDATRSFLTDVGLPTQGPGGTRFYHDDRLLRLLRVGATDYLAVGDDYGTTLALKLGTDELWSVDPHREIRPRFVNSLLSDFVLFLGIFDSRGAERQLASDENDQVIVQEIRTQFVSRDARALDDADNWWSLVLEQMSHGLL